MFRVSGSVIPTPAVPPMAWVPPWCHEVKCCHDGTFKLSALSSRTPTLPADVTGQSGPTKKKHMGFWCKMYMFIKCECSDIHPKKEIMDYLLHIIKFCPTSPKDKLLSLAANDSFQTVGSEPGFSSTKPMVFLEGFVVQCVVFTKRWCDF